MEENNNIGRARLREALEMSDSAYLEKYPPSDEEDLHISYLQMKQLIQKHKRKHFRRCILKISRYVAAILIFVGVFLMCGNYFDAFAQPQDSMDFCTEVDEDGYLYVFFDWEGREGAPKTLEVKYAPSYIPEGYVSDFILNGRTQTRIKYDDSNGNRITFEQWTKSMSWGVKTDAASFEIRRVEDIRVGIYTYYHKTQYVAYWSNGDYGFYFLIEAPLSMEEIEKMILSVEPIETEK